MSSSMLGRTAVISGAARGIGRAVAERFARNGAKVVILDLDQDAAETAAKEIAGATGNDALGIGCNVTERDSVEEAISAGHARY